MKIVLATNNPGKIQEFKHLFSHFPVELIPQSKLGVAEIEENGLSFIENAILKARHASLKTGLPAIADDSGLTVDVLGGAPGIYSARYAGEAREEKANIDKLLLELADVLPEKRQAQFHCVLAFMNEANDPIPLVCHGIWHGFILTAPRGIHGFGYDPIFLDPIKNKSAAELSAEIKNKISHRAKALHQLVQSLKEKWAV